MGSEEEFFLNVVSLAMLMVHQNEFKGFCFIIFGCGNLSRLSIHLYMFSDSFNADFFTNKSLPELAPIRLCLIHAETPVITGVPIQKK